jgi:hypothetical protein
VNAAAASWAPLTPGTRPFLFAILDNATGLPVFPGQVSRPRSGVRNGRIRRRGALFRGGQRFEQLDELLLAGVPGPAEPGAGRSARRRNPAAGGGYRNKPLKPWVRLSFQYAMC